MFKKKKLPFTFHFADKFNNSDEDLGQSTKQLSTVRSRDSPSTRVQNQVLRHTKTMMQPEPANQLPGTVCIITLNNNGIGDVKKLENPWHYVSTARKCLHYSLNNQGKPVTLHDSLSSIE